jgi:hypothetical protein
MKVMYLYIPLRLYNSQISICYNSCRSPLNRKEIVHDTASHRYPPTVIISHLSLVCHSVSLLMSYAHFNSTYEGPASRRRPSKIASDGKQP